MARCCPRPAATYGPKDPARNGYAEPDQLTTADCDDAGRGLLAYAPEQPPAAIPLLHMHVESEDYERL